MAICYPDNAIWPDPSVLPVEPTQPEDESGLPEYEEAMAAYELAVLQVEIALEFAWTTLQTLSAYQIAICPITVRPSQARCGGGSYFIAPVLGPIGSSFWPYVVNGQWLNAVCNDGEGCGCGRVQQVILPGPVGDIVEVVIDGVTLDPADYRVDSGNKLVRQDGDVWPSCQNFNLPAGEVGTFTVTYYHGATADRLVRYAAGILADEYLKAITGSGECRLPSGTTEIVRQGITISVNQNFFEDGNTGIPEVNAVIRRFNPYGARMPSQIFSLDRQPARQTTWSAPAGS